jgi:hypothetical protein
MAEQADQLHHNNAPAHSTALMLDFLANDYIIQVCQHPYSPYLSPRDFWLYPKVKSPLKKRRFVNVTVTQCTSSVSSVLLPTN